MLYRVAVLLLLWPAWVQAQPVRGFADDVERLLPSVVSIQTTQSVQGQRVPEGHPLEKFFERFGTPNPQDRRNVALGSGFIIDSDGHIVTNHHVIKDAEDISVILNDQQVLTATVVGADERTDVALLKVETSEPLVAVSWAEKDNSRVGDWVLAIGNPLGLGGTVTAGIISARGRNIRSGPYDDFIQTDAPINRGNSGGPLFNLDGEVIGINTAIFSQTGGSIGIGFAIPAKQARQVVAQLQEYGETRRGWLGTAIQHVTPEIAENLRLDRARGALVLQVYRGTPAEAAGVQAGDIILSFDEQAIEQSTDLPWIVANTKVGQQVEVELWRDGKRVSVDVVTGRLEEASVSGVQRSSQSGGGASAQKAEIESLGMTVINLTPTEVRSYNLPPDAEGVVISEVKPQGPAARKGLTPGTLIVGANRQDVMDIEDVVAAVEKSGQKPVLFLIKDRGGTSRFVALKAQP